MSPPRLEAALWCSVAVLCLAACPRFEDPSRATSPPARPDVTRDQGRDLPPEQAPDQALDLDQAQDQAQDQSLGVDQGSDAGSSAPQTLSLWAPQAVSVELSLDQDRLRLPMRSGPTPGRWSISTALLDGQPYRFLLQTAQGQTLTRHDPRALQVDDSGQGSVHVAPAPVTRQAHALERVILYELHPGSFWAPGRLPATFAQAASKLDHVRDLGATALALMPVHEFPGELSWGYNPTHLYAVERAYGGARGLIALIQQAHALGLSVLADVVYNHLDGATPLCHFDLLVASGPCGQLFYSGELGQTDWGPRPSFAHPEARALLVEHPTRWMQALGFDGFRWDSTSNIRATNHGRGPRIQEGWTLMQQANDAVHALGGLSIAEDLQGDPALTSPVSQGGAGFDAQWDAAFHGVVVSALEAAREGRAQVRSLSQLIEGLGQRPFTSVVYTESHDTTGQLNGHVRLPEQLSPSAPGDPTARALCALGAVMMMTVPALPMLLQGQEFLSVGAFHDSAPLDWSRVQSEAQTVALYRALIALRLDRGGHTRGLLGPHVQARHVNDQAQVFAYRRWDRGGAGDDVMIILNLSQTSFSRYRLGVPEAGAWRVRLDTADPQGRPQDSATLTAQAQPYDGYGASLELSLAPRSAVILSQDPAP